MRFTFTHGERFVTVFQGFGRSMYLLRLRKRHNLLAVHALMEMAGKPPYNQIKRFIFPLPNILTKVILRILDILLFDLLAKCNCAEQITQLQPHLLCLLHQLCFIWELFHPNC